MTLPSPGLGTSGNDDFEDCAETVRHALELGYRHVDTAQAYDNEAAVGEGIDRAAVNREDVFVATKVHPDNLGPADVRSSTEESLDRLGLEYVDLLYVHWPVSAYDGAETLPAFDRLREDGLIEHIGLSNFTPSLLEEARSILDAPILAHQVECHPWLPQEQLRAYANEHDHYLVAYSPVMQGQAGEDETLVDVGERNDVTPYQASLAWLEGLENVVSIPKGTGEHVAENWAARNLHLSADDVSAIAGISHRERLVDPDVAVWNQ